MSPAHEAAVAHLPFQVRCPACGQEDHLQEFAVGADEAAQHFVLKEFDAGRHAALANHIRRLWGADTCSLVKCTECDCRFAVPFVAGDEAFYTLAYQRAGYPGDKWEYRRALDVIGGLSPQRRRLLEIGAGSGRFIEQVAPALVRRDDVVATEYSDFGIEELRRLGVRALRCDFRTLSRDQCSGGFDVVCLFQVLEHLHDLEGAFRKLRELCNDEGLVLLSTPSDERIRFNEANGALLDMPPNHVTLWCREAMERIARRTGFRLAEHWYEPRSVAKDALLFLKYRFLRSSQREGSLPNAIWSLRSARARKVLSAVWIACTLPVGLGTLIRGRRLSSGESQFAVLVRDPSLDVAGDRTP